MSKDEFIKKCSLILSKRNGTIMTEGKIGFLQDRNKCDWNGVYVIFKDDELLYIGSGYTPETHKIKDRLSQYVTKSSTGNNLWEKVVNEGWATNEDEAIEVIKTFDFIAFEHNDLEKCLINVTGSKWNDRG